MIMHFIILDYYALVVNTTSPGSVICEQYCIHTCNLKTKWFNISYKCAFKINMHRICLSIFVVLPRYTKNINNRMLLIASL